MDQFHNKATGLESPAYNAAELTPSDASALSNVTRALWVGGGGDVSITLASGDTVLLKNATGWMPVRAQKLLATGTTATDIVGVW